MVTRCEQAALRATACAAQRHAQADTGSVRRWARSDRRSSRARTHTPSPPASALMYSVCVGSYFRVVWCFLAFYCRIYFRKNVN